MNGSCFQISSINEWGYFRNPIGTSVPKYIRSYPPPLTLWLFHVTIGPPERLIVFSPVKKGTSDYMSIFFKFINFNRKISGTEREREQIETKTLLNDNYMTVCVILTSAGNKNSKKTLNNSKM